MFDLSSRWSLGELNYLCSLPQHAIFSAAEQHSGVLTRPPSPVIPGLTDDFLSSPQAGMPEELLQLQPLDLRYSHLLQPYKSCIGEEERM